MRKETLLRKTALTAWPLFHLLQIAPASAQVYESTDTPMYIPDNDPNGATADNAPLHDPRA